ncbi:hypothetical protein OAQ28_05855 [Planktomarina temperata]|jgi:hypothetical protein|nr:hypothetical protein [Planktomarina temperata]
MNLNWAVVKIFGFLIGTMHLVMVALLLFALYAKSDPETAGEIIGNINWMNLLNPSFEMIIAIIFLLYVILVGTLSVLLNISKRHDESVQVLNEIRDLLKPNNNGDRDDIRKFLTQNYNTDKTVSPEESPKIPPFMKQY